MKSVKGQTGQKNKGQAARAALSAVSLAIAVFAGVASNSAWAVTAVNCDSSVASSLQAQAVTALGEQKERIDKAVVDNSLDQETPASGITNSAATGLGAVNLSCFNSIFSLGNAAFSIPSLDQALQMAGQFAVNSACSAAQSAIRSVTQNFGLSKTLNSGIPGLGISGNLGTSGNSVNLTGTNSTVSGLTGGDLSTSNLTGLSSTTTSTTGTSVVNGAASSVKSWVLGN